MVYENIRINNKLNVQSSEPNFLVENEVIYGDFLQLNDMFGQIFLPAIIWCKCFKHAILTQTFPLTFRFVKEQHSLHHSREGEGVENPPII